MELNNVVVIEQFFYEYTGGAHGNYGAFYYNIDKITGKILTLQDLFDELNVTYQQVKDALLQKSKTEDYSIDGVSIFYTDCEESIDYIMLEGCWYYEEKGVVFVAQPYALAPYAEGIIEFPLTYEQF